MLQLIQVIQMHSCEFRIYYEDTDVGGIVYHANYLKYTERGRTEYLRSLGFSNSEMLKTNNVGVVVRHLDIDYKNSAKLDDLITVTSEITQINNASFTMKQNILKNSLTLVTMIVKLACIDIDSGKPVRIPSILKEKINE